MIAENEIGHRGKLIVIDGTDGSGKKTQTALLLSRLQKEGYNALTLSFPQYGKKSAGLVEEYLNGKYGRPDEVSPYAASLFYALDRFDLSSDIRRALNERKIVVTDRYVTANAGHQGGKIKDMSERKKFVSWMYHVEYDILQIPRPDLVVILHVPAEIGQELVLEKQQRLYLEKSKIQDIHEADFEHLKAAENSYIWLVRQFPKDHKIIECVEEGELLSPKAIHEKLWQVILPTLRDVVLAGGGIVNMSHNT